MDDGVRVCVGGMDLVRDVIMMIDGGGRGALGVWRRAEGLRAEGWGF